MSELDVIIPVYNEADNIEELYRRLDNSLTSAAIDYRAIFVDDNSLDQTGKIVEKLANGRTITKKFGSSRNGNFTNGESKFNLGNIVFDASTGKTNGNTYYTNGESSNGSKIKLLYKKGRQGKAFSILEGARIADARYIAMIDGDLQYPPEAIPQMLRIARKNGGVVVANRKKQETSSLRRFGSKANSLLFGKLLLGLECDIQSGLKVFKKELIEAINEQDVTPWTLDVPLLIKAKELGFHIDSHDIEFKERKRGHSKVHFLKTSLEIAASSIRSWLKKDKIYSIKSEKGQTVGSGVIHKGRRYITHSQLPLEASALETLVGWQKATFVAAFSLFILGLIIHPIYTGIFLLSILTLIYFLDLVFSVITLTKNLDFVNEIKIEKKEIDDLNEKELPIYTILCPLYKEAEVLQQFVYSIEQLNWPKDKLDVILLLEEDDAETIEKVNSLKLPFYCKALIVPHASPKTKPKACNFGLAHAKGEYIVIYDAEDKPDPLQLKKAYLGFKKVNPKVVCLQSKLNYYNPNHNLLTKLFTAEYCLWFDLILPGLQNLQTTIPLGGTSNHFKTKILKFLDGWDSFNVTEDCDLGARLFKKGFKTEILDSTTLEEANSNLGSWLRQRSRWIKGYLQTYFVHMRRPFEFVKRHGIHSFVFQLIIGMRMSFMLINPLLWVMTFSYFVLNSYVGETIEALYPTFIFYLAASSMVFGNFIYLYAYMVAVAKRKKWDLIKYIFFIPLYWLFASIAAVKAFYQLFSKPYYWEKTQHGYHLVKGKDQKSIIFSIEFDNRVDFAYLARLLKPIYSPFISLVKSIVDLTDVVLPLPQNGGPKNGGLRILVFNWRDTKHMWSGGAEVYIHEICKRWVAMGHKVTLFCGWDGRTRRNGVVDGVEVVRRGGFYTLYLFAFIYYIFKFRRRYDVIVESENGIPFFTPLYSRIPKILIVHHVHQEVFRRYLPTPLAKFASFIESEVSPYVYKNQKIIAVSQSTKDDLIAIGRGIEENIEIVNPGVNVNNKQFTKTLNPAFVYMGRLKPYKNIDIAIEAFSKLYKKYPNCTFNIAGFGEIFGDLKRQVKKLGLEDKVKILGKVSEEEKIRLLGESWVAIQPSSFEGWGITVLEANSCGTPVIASDAPGLKDSVKDGITGILVTPKDSNALADAMEKIMLDTRLRLSLSENAYLWAGEFNWEKCADKFIKVVYDSAFGESLAAAVGVVKT